jgi:hypothetical protein
MTPSRAGRPWHALGRTSFGPTLCESVLVGGRAFFDSFSAFPQNWPQNRKSAPARSTPANRADTMSPWTRARPCAQSAEGDSKQELSCQFGKGHEGPNLSGKKSARLPAVLVADHSPLEGNGAERRRCTLRSRTLARLILLPSFSSIGGFGFKLEEVCSNAHDRRHGAVKVVARR